MNLLKIITNKKTKNNSVWAVFKLFFYLTVSDLAGLILVAIAPILISLIWIIVIHETVILPYPDLIFANDPVTFLWYPTSMFSGAFISFFYVAIKFNSFKNTILFKKILIGGISKLNIVLMLFIFYFIMATFLVGTKIVMLSYYKGFRNEFANINIFGLLLGFLLFITTNICLGIAFSNVAKKIVVIAVGGFFLMFLLLFFQGIFFDLEISLFVIQDIEIENVEEQTEKKLDLNLEKSVFSTYKNAKAYQNMKDWTNISEEAKILRYIRFLNPYQPSFNIIRQAHINKNWTIPQKLGLDIDARMLGNYLPPAISRPMVYQNYWFPVLVNSFWIFSSLAISYHFLKK